MIRRRDLDAQAGALYAFLADRSGGAWVALDEGTPVGIALASASADECTIHDLFVEPTFRGQGIGRALLGAAQGEEEIARTGVLATSDPATMAFALARGVIPQSVLLHYAGAIPREDDLLRLVVNDYRFGTRDLDTQADGNALDAIDREVRGCARALDHEYFAARAHGTSFFLNDEFVGYAYVWANGRVGPIASASPAYTGAFFGFALAASAAHHGASWCTALLPAANARANRAALGAGLRVIGSATFAGDSAAHDFARYIAFHELWP